MTEYRVRDQFGSRWIQEGNWCEKTGDKAAVIDNRNRSESRDEMLGNMANHIFEGVIKVDGQSR